MHYFTQKTTEVELPADVVDIEGDENKNPNDLSLVRLERDCKFISEDVLLQYYITHVISYMSILSFSNVILVTTYGFG